MHRTRFLFSVIILSLVFSAASYSAPSRSGSIEIKEIKGNFELTVPASRIILTIPKGGLVQETMATGGSTNNPRYFYLSDSTFDLIISGWIESDQRFSGVKKAWEDDTTAWKRGGLPEPQNISFSKIGQWDVVIYDMTIPDGNNSHIRAHWVQAGTWIDIHMSITVNRPITEIRAKLQSIIKTIQVKQKGQGTL
jgi:hypothetical protein